MFEPSRLIIECFSRHRLIRMLVFIAVLLYMMMNTLGPIASASAAELTREQQKLLSSLDPQSVKMIIELSDNIKETRRTISNSQTYFLQLKNKSKEIITGADKVDFVEIFTATEKIVQNLKKIKGRLPADISKHINLDGLNPLIEEYEKANQSWKQIKYDPEDPDSEGEQAFQTEMRELVILPPTIKLVEELVTKTFPRIDTLRDPANYINQFVETELTKYLDNPYPVGDFKFTIMRSNSTAPHFSEKANLKIKIQYAGIQYPGVDTSVEASGFYFKYRNGQLPAPGLDRLKVETNALAVIKKTALRALGDGMPDLGLPIKVKDVQFIEFGPQDNGKGGALRFQLEMGLLDFASGLKAEAKNVTVYSNGKVDFEGAEIDWKEEIPISTTGLSLSRNKGTVTQKPNRDGVDVKFNTLIGPVKSSSETLALDVEITFSLPLDSSKGVGLEGKLIQPSTGLQLGEANGGLSAERVWARVEVPSKTGSAAALAHASKFNIEFTIDGNGLSGDGLVTLFSVIKQQFEITLNFDGSASMTALQNIQILGISLDATARFSTKKGFKNPILTARSSLELDLPPPMDLTLVSVSIRIENANNPSLKATAKAIGITASVRVSLSAEVNIAKELQKKFKERSPEAVQIIMEVGKALDIFNKNSAVRGIMAQFDVFNKNTVFRGLGRKLDETLNPFDPDSQTAKAGRNIGNTLSKGLSDTANEGKRFFKRVGGGLFGKAAPGDNDLMLANYTNDLTMLTKLALIQSDGKKIPESAVERVKLLTELISRIHILKQPSVQIDDSDAGRMSKGQMLSLKLGLAAAGPIGKSDNDTTIAFLIRNTGYNDSYNSRTGSSQEIDGSELKWGVLEIRNINGKDGRPPQVKMELPLLENYSKYPAQELLRDELQDLVERFFPDAEIDGQRRFFEKRLKIQNNTDERLTVWIQRRSRVRTADGLNYEWRWIPESGDAGQAKRIVVQPHNSANVFLIRDIDLPGNSPKLRIPLTASRIRVWAESASGDRWIDDRHRDIWLVPANPEKNSTRVYYGKEFETYTYSFNPLPSPRQFAERQVSLLNRTNEELVVSLRYLSEANGSMLWQTLPDLHVAAGQTVIPTDPRTGFRIRAAEINVVAESNNFLFDYYQTNLLPLVQVQNGHRIYWADHVGNFTHVFQLYENESE